MKGVNKNVIEICDTGSDYFERAILFVRQNAVGNDNDTMRKHAGEFLSTLKIRYWWQPKRGYAYKFLKALCAAGAAAAAVCALVMR